MAVKDTSCLHDVLKYHEQMKQLICDFKINSRLFIANITTLIEKLENGELDIHSGEIGLLLHDRSKFSTDADHMKNQLEEIKIKLEGLEFKKRDTPGRQRDSGIESADSRVLNSTTDVICFDSSSSDCSLINKSKWIQETVVEARKDGMEHEDVENTYL